MFYEPKKDNGILWRKKWTVQHVSKNSEVYLLTKLIKRSC